MRRLRHRHLAPLSAVLAVLSLAPAAAAASRPLAQGSSGRSVVAVQTLLADLSYLPWSGVNGSYDYRTAQAVMAFEGWSGLTRDGIATTRVVQRLRSARRPHPWSRYHERRIEVHVARQVALLIDAQGRVLRAIHVSSGASGKTPLGDFKIFRKEARSWSYAFSVVLPFASYFSNGFAFHQYPDVPGYAASHGCVRVPAPEAPVLYGFATYGTVAHIHA